MQPIRNILRSVLTLAAVCAAALPLIAQASRATLELQALEAQVSADLSRTLASLSFRDPLLNARADRAAGALEELASDVGRLAVLRFDLRLMSLAAEFDQAAANLRMQAARYATAIGPRLRSVALQYLLGESVTSPAHRCRRSRS